MEKKKIILGYWHHRCLSEQIRLLLEYLNLPYENHYYEVGPGPEFNKDCWYNKKYTLGLEFPNLPYLIDGEIRLTESMAILKYICMKYCPRLLGETIIEKAEVDMLNSVLYDFNNLKVRILYEYEITPEMMCTLHEGFEKFASLLDTRRYICGDFLSYLDFFFLETLESTQDLLEPVVEKYPSFRRFFNEITSIPQIKAYRNSERYTSDPLPYNNKYARLGSVPLKKYCKNRLFSCIKIKNQQIYNHERIPMDQQYIYFKSLETWEYSNFYSNLFLKFRNINLSSQLLYYQIQLTYQELFSHLSYGG